MEKVQNEEKIIVYAKEENAIVKEIRKLTEQSETALLGYKNSEIVKLEPMNIHCISVIDNKVYAICDNEKYLLKERLYTLEAKLPESFVKINQSCLANIKKIVKIWLLIKGQSIIIM